MNTYIYFKIITRIFNAFQFGKMHSWQMTFTSILGVTKKVPKVCTHEELILIDARVKATKKVQKITYEFGIGQKAI